MKRLAVVMAIVAVCFVGCCTIPAAVKTQIDFVDTVTDVALKELKDAENADQVAEISSRALLRLAPHTENLRQWAEGQGGGQ